MADSDIENRYTDARKVQGTATKPGNLGDSRYTSVNALRTRLTAINAGYYTTARLNQMTKNDMEYAVRQADDAGGIR